MFLQSYLSEIGLFTCTIAMSSVHWNSLNPHSSLKVVFLLSGYHCIKLVRPQYLKQILDCNVDSM